MKRTLAVAGVIVALLWAPSGRAAEGLAAAAIGQADPAGEAEALVARAREHGARFVASNERAARDAARKDLDAAERLVRNELKRNPGCETCLQVQASVHLFRSYFRVDDQYDDAIEVAGRGLTRYPQNATFAYIKGYAHYAKNQQAQAVAAFKRYLAMDPDPAQAAEVRTLVDDAQQRFLTGWYNQAAFYQSNESRITTLNPQTFRNEVVFQVTPEYEMQLGYQGFSALSQSAPPANDPEAVAFLQQLTARLMEKTPGPGFRYQVTLLDSPDVNAVTPPGYIIVYAGLLRAVDTEAQLAGVLAHELAHNYGHHSARRVIKAYHAQQVAASITRAINPQGAASQVITQVSTTLGVDLFLKAYSRFEEQEADEYGTHLMFNAGYNPTAMASFFLKLYEANPKQPVKFLSTHPPHPDRINYLSEYLEPFPLDRELVVDSSEAFTRIKQRYPSPGASAPGAATPAGIPMLPRKPPPGVER